MINGVLICTLQSMHPQCKFALLGAITQMNPNCTPAALRLHPNFLEYNTFDKTSTRWG